VIIDDAPAGMRSLADVLAEMGPADDYAPPGEIAALSPAAAAPDGPWQSKFGGVRFSEIDDDGGDEFDFLIDEFLSVGDRSVIGGASQSGKSFLGIHIGLCVARGVDFFGRKVRRGAVIYQAGEGGRGVKKRLRAYRNHFGVPSDEDVPFVLLTHPVDLFRADGDTKPLIAEIAAWQAKLPLPISLIVIDTFATATPGAEENSGRDMSIALSHVADIARATGAHVCIVHHLNASGTKLRGHTSIYANVDQVIEVERNEQTGVRTATLTKQKDAPAGVKFQFELMAVKVGYNEWSRRDVTSCVVLPVGEKQQERTKAAVGLRGNEDPVFRALLSALKAKGEFAPAELGLPVGTRAVRFHDWREAFVAIDASADDDEGKRKERQRKALERSGAGLLKIGVIGRANPWVWWTGKPVAGFPETFPKTRAASARSVPEPDAASAAAAAAMDEADSFL